MTFVLLLMLSWPARSEFFMHSVTGFKTKEDCEAAGVQAQSSLKDSVKLQYTCLKQ